MQNEVTSLPLQQDIGPSQKTGPYLWMHFRRPVVSVCDSFKNPFLDQAFEITLFVPDAKQVAQSVKTVLDAWPAKGRLLAYW